MEITELGVKLCKAKGQYSRTSPYGHLSNADSSLDPGKIPIHPL